MFETELKSLYPSAKILKNIYCPTLDGNTSEIDIIMISTDGIFLFEAKNFSARITGDWSKDKLIAIYPNGKEIEILNPVIQNSYHFQHLRKLLGINNQYAIKNIVVLGDSVVYNKEDLKTVPSFASVCKFKGISRAVFLRSKYSKDIFKDTQVESLYETIKEQLSYTEDKKNKHINSTKSKLN